MQLPSSDSGDLLVRGGDVLLGDRGARDADVLITGRRDRGDRAPASGTDVPELDAAGKIVMPGLVNAHYHSGENFNPGLLREPSARPLVRALAPGHARRARCQRRDLRANALGAVQMLHSGTTGAVDFSSTRRRRSRSRRSTPRPAYRDVGMRATILLGVADKPSWSRCRCARSARARAAAEAAARRSSASSRWPRQPSTAGTSRRA